MNSRAWRRSLIRTYFTFDGRSLALCRVLLGGILIVDLLRRIVWIRELYSNDGLLPNHTVLWRPLQPRVFSFFFMASHSEETAVGFAIAFCAFFCLLIGYRTRIAHIVSFAMTTSLHCRILFAENGGAVALGALVFWTMFLPMGRRFSVDAVLVSLRARPNEMPSDLSPSRRPAPDTRPHVSLAVLAVLLQLVTIYAFNYLHKSGATWNNGTAVYYVLQQERIVTSLGLWVRHHLPFAATVALTRGTLVTEAMAPFLLMSPLFRRPLRALAIASLTALHAGIALLVNLGIFSAAMIGYYPMLIDTAHWDWIARHTPGKPRIVVYDAGCGVCFQIVRVLARMDSRHQLTWIASEDWESLPVKIPPEVFEGSIVVIDAGTGRSWTQASAVAELVASLPFGRLVAWILWVPGIGGVADRIYNAFAQHRERISVGLGFRACSIASPTDAAAGADASPSAPGAAPFAQFWRSRVPLFREVGVGVALVVAAADMSVSNRVVPREDRWESRPDWMAAAVMYTHVSEGWGMFAPEAPIYDEMIVVDALTRDGRHVDPYNEVGSRVHSLPVADIPERLGNDSFFCDYTLRVQSNPAYFQAFSEWVRRYPDRTGNANDSIVSFEIFKIEHTPPAPGETKATNIRRTTLVKWPEAT